MLTVSPSPVAGADVARRPGARIQRRLVDRREQHGRVGVEDVVRPVAVVDVPVEDRARARAPCASTRVPRRDRDVVEEAEAHRPRGLGVVAGRASAATRRRRPRRRAARRRARPRRRGVQRRLVRALATRRCRRRSRRRRARAQRLDRVDVRPRVDAVQRLARRRRGRLDTLAARASRPRRAPPRSRRSARRAPDGPGVVLRARRRDAAGRRHGMRDTVPRDTCHGRAADGRRRRRRRRRRRPLRRAHRRRAKARRSRSCQRHAARRRPPATGRRAGSPRRSPSTTRPSCTSRTPSAPAAALVRRVGRARCSSTRRRRASRELEQLGVRFDADRHGNLALGLEGGHSRRRIVHAGGSATGRRIVRAALGASSRDTSTSRSSKAARAAALWIDGRPRVGRRCEDGRAIAARATILATGGAAALWSRTTNPPGSLGIGLVLAHAAGAALADLEFVQFHPTAVTGHRRAARASSSPRRSAARARRCTAPTASASSTSSRRATRSRARSTAMLRETGAPSVGLDMRDVDPARFPNVVAALREAGLDPTTRARPGRPRRALHDGRDRHRPARPQRRVPGLYAVGESRLHRPARRQPPGLELAERVLRLRRARGARRRSTSRAPAPGAAAPQPPIGRRAAEPRDPRGAVARRRAGARPRRACERCSTTSTRSRAWSPPARCARGEPRAHRRADFPGTRPDSTATHRRRPGAATPRSSAGAGPRRRHRSSS